jgi:hypothetical protein
MFAGGFLLNGFNGCGLSEINCKILDWTDWIATIVSAFACMMDGSLQ